MHQSGVPFRLLLFVTSVILVSSLSTVALAESSLDLTPGVVAQAERGVMFVMTPSGGMTELSLASGQAIWQTTAAAKPLLVHEGRLLAQAEGRPEMLELRVFDLANRGDDPVRIDYRLPANARAAVDEGMLVAFRVRAVVRDGEPYVIWSYTRNLSRLQPAYAEQIDTHVRGALRVDLDARTAVPVDIDTVVADRDVTEAIPPGAEALVASPRTAGAFLAGLELRGNPGATRDALLQRWNVADGQPLAAVPLLTADVRRWVFSVENRHLLLGSVRREAAPESRFAWTLFSMETGEQLVEIYRPRSGAEHVVHEDKLVYLAEPMRVRVGEAMVDVPKSVEAVGLSDGAVAWSQAIRDVAYRGPYPKRLPPQVAGPSRPDNSARN